jgi:hypothetical protein
MLACFIPGDNVLLLWISVMNRSIWWIDYNMELNRKSKCMSLSFGEAYVRELFVMSKCPDGEDGEATIANVMEKVGHKVSLNFTYIARY